MCAVKDARSAPLRQDTPGTVSPCRTSGVAGLNGAGHHGAIPSQRQAFERANPSVRRPVRSDRARRARAWASSFQSPVLQLFKRVRLILTVTPFSTSPQRAQVVAILTRRCAPAILRCLSEEAQFFNSLHRILPGIAHKVLTDHLRFLERQKVIERHRPVHTQRSAYQLTERGRELLPLLCTLSEWDDRWRED